MACAMARDRGSGRASSPTFMRSRVIPSTAHMNSSVTSGRSSVLQVGSTEGASGAATGGINWHAEMQEDTEAKSTIRAAGLDTRGG